MTIDDQTTNANVKVDFEQTPWQWCKRHDCPERIEWTMVDCERTGWYRTNVGAMADNI